MELHGFAAIASDLVNIVGQRDTFHYCSGIQCSMEHLF